MAKAIRHQNDIAIDSAKRVIAAGIRKGKKARAEAPSRSTGYRRELQAHSDALMKVRELLSK